jgi:hypothetical protein
MRRAPSRSTSHPVLLFVTPVTVCDNQMTLYAEFEISLWAARRGLLPIKEDVEAVGTLLAHPSMVELGAPTQTFFTELSTCNTTKHLYRTIHMHQLLYRTHMHQHRPADSDPIHCFDPSEYKITEIVVSKRRLFIQHEGIILRVHHEPQASAQHPAEPDFLISIDRDIDLTGLKPFFSSPKLAIDHVDCYLSPAATPASPAVPHIKGTYGRPVVWRMPAPGNNYRFNLNLSEFAVLLNAVSFSYPQQQYSALYKNCFSHSRILRAVIIRIIQGQQPTGGNNVVAAHEPNRFGVTLGNCFGFRLDRDEGEDEVVFTNYGNLYTQFLS